MEYSKLVEVYEQLEQTQSTLDKTSIIADFFEENPEDVEKVVLLCMGRIFPSWRDLDLGVSSKTLIQIIKNATGRSEEEIEQAWKTEGDLGLAAEKMAEQKTQQRLFQKDLTVERVLEKLEKVAKMEKESLGSVSMDKKTKELAELISSANPREARYIARTIIENLRLGVGEGIIRDALAEAFFGGEHAEEIQRGYDLTNDFIEVSEACSQGIDAVTALEMEMMKPINSMLAMKVNTIEEGFEKVGKPAAVDFKYDGMRAQIHIKEDEVRVFTRRLDDVTKQFPDVVKKIREHIDCEDCILDTEIVAFDPEDGSTIPFQRLSKRIKRKYDIQKLSQEIPVEVRPFDIIYQKGSLLEENYGNRWERLKGVVDEEKHRVRLAEHDITSETEEVQRLQQKALSEGHEGIMMKSLDAQYKPGSRVGYMIKLKPVMETLDLAIIGAKWGEGRRSGWLSRLKLGCYDEKNDEYLQVGRLATGLTDEQFKEITEKLEPLITEEDGRDVTVRPEVIIEAEYEEIQKSPNYTSGYALRFPRMKQFRDDKERADSLEKVENLYNGQ